MKKALIIANMLFASVNVLGMDLNRPQTSHCMIGSKQEKN